ncbi:MAG: hypothetical protein Kow0081_2900 [Candidatus Dojkabacteria bacterium]
MEEKDGLSRFQSFLIKKFVIAEQKPTYFNFFMLSIIALILFMQNVLGLNYGMNFFVIVVALVAIYRDDGYEFFKDFWLPVILMFSYEVLRAQAFSFSQSIGARLWVGEIADLEKTIFFFLDDLPNVILQSFFNPNVQTPYLHDYILFSFYGFFFWAWAIFAMGLWFYKREFFKPYTYGLILFSFVSVAIFTLFPTAPPWYASQAGEIPQLERVLWEFEYLPGMELDNVQDVGRNDFAAIPSLHTGWMVYAAIWFVHIFGKKYWWVFFAPFGVAFATWYGAEHYIVDSIVGALMALTFFAIAWRYYKRSEKLNVS